MWPTVRIEEAWREGLDAIALSDHIEYQPHQEDIPTRHERPYEIALPKAQEMNVLLIKGAEITKDTPPGHYNAVFIKEIDPIGNRTFLMPCALRPGRKVCLLESSHMAGRRSRPVGRGPDNDV